jgi:ribosomal subunit interface protein
MRLQIKARQVNITPDLRRIVDTRLARLERLMNDSIVSAHLALAREKNRYAAELTVHARGDHILHGVGTTGSWGTSLTSAVSKVMQQAEKVKGKWKARKKG